MKHESIKEHDGFTPLETILKRQKPLMFLTGFTLIEMMVVVIIIGILASLAIPRYQKTVERSRISEALSILGDIRTAQYRFASEHNRFTGNLGDLDMNVTQSGKYFNFVADNSSSKPFDGNNDVLANATRKDLQGGSYGNCFLYTISIYEFGNFSAGTCTALNAILN